jgi:hypothetical protein
VLTQTATNIARDPARKRQRRDNGAAQQSPVAHSQAKKMPSPWESILKRRRVPALVLAIPPFGLGK